MFNEYLEMSEENADIIMANSVIENLKFIVISLDTVFKSEICDDCDTDEEKVKAIYEWMIHNFEYVYEYEPIVQYFNVRKTLSTRKGICYDFAHLFASLCRSQNIPCYIVDGDKRDNAQYHHTWNRVYFDSSWWNIDVTFDTVQTENQGSLYGLREIEAPYSQDGEYFIKRIY